MSMPPQLDMIIVGGGLSGCLLAWRLSQRRPDLRVCLLEAGDRLGGNHTWSSFDTDLTAAQRSWIAPVVVHHWDAYDVRFPRVERTLHAGYNSITSQRLHEVVSAALGERVQYNASAASLNETSVKLRDGRQFDAACVIDARGAHASPHLLLGFQKFLGLEVELLEGREGRLPTIMDATVRQADGYRFVYTLPLAPDRMLIEDTYYSDGGDLAPEMLRARIRAYAEARGWHIASVLREETGVLPIILAGDIEKFLASYADVPPKIGLGAALFHPTTGYSLPDAVRLADRLASGGPATTAEARHMVAEMVRNVWRERAIFRMLNRFLFKAGVPAERYRILERFYGLNDELIRNFYAGRLTALQKLRVLAGKPPVPIRSAIPFVSEGRMLRRPRGIR